MTTVTLVLPGFPGACLVGCPDGVATGDDSLDVAVELADDVGSATGRSFAQPNNMINSPIPTAAKPVRNILRSEPSRIHRPR